MMSRLLTMAAALALCASGCGGGSGADDGDVVTLKVGVLPITNVAPLYLGEKKGFFKQKMTKASGFIEKDPEVERLLPEGGEG